MIGWFTNIKGTIHIILRNIKRIIIGKGNILNLGYSICILILFVYIKQNKKINFDTILLLLIIISPLILNIITGSELICRSLFTLPFMMSFIFYEFYDLKKYIKILLLLIVISQFTHCYLLLISDYKRYINDVNISKKIYNDCGK